MQLDDTIPRPQFLSTKRMDLRPAEEEDIDFVQRAVNHPQIRKYISVYRTPYSEERVRDEIWPIQTGDEGVSLLAVPTTGEWEGDPVGSVQLYPHNEADGYANFGVWFLPAVWGKGYASEASAQVIDFGFQSIRIHRISATVMAPNDAAINLCERLGFVHEGTAREAQFANGGYVDVERYGLLKSDWDGVESIT